MSGPPIPGEPREWKVAFFFAPSGHACEKATNEVSTGKSPRTIGLEERTPAGEGGEGPTDGSRGTKWTGQSLSPVKGGL